MKFYFYPTAMPKTWLNPKFLLIMKLTAFILMTVLMQVSAKGYGQKISLKENNVPLEKVLNSIKNQSGYVFIYNDDDWKNVNVSIDIKDASIEETLNKCFEDLPFTFKIIRKEIVITKKEPSFLEKIMDKIRLPIKVRGVVFIEGGLPLKDAVVKIKGGRKSILTNINGEFELDDVPEGATIIITYTGYKKKEIAVPANNFLKVIMEVDVALLTEVRVSNGYNSLPQERATGSFGVIKARELERIPVPNILQRMEGLVPGLTISAFQSDASFTYKNLVQNTVNDGSNSSYNIQIRGLSTFNANKAPLIVVDGVITDFDLRTFNPNDVEQITVLKDAAAASIWGIRAANGVIVIQTKKGSPLKPTVAFTANYNIAGSPRLKYIPQMNAKETIDYELDLINRGIITDPTLNTFTPARYLDQAQEIIFQQKRGNISLAQRDSQLAALGNYNSYDQISEYLLRPASSQQYTASIAGGSTNSKYYFSAAYANEKTNEIGTGGKRLNLTANNDFSLFSIATLTTSVKAAFSNFDINGLGYGTLIPSPIQFMPYDRLVDENGKSINYSYAYYAPILNDAEKKGYLNWRYNYIDELNLANNKVKENSFQINIGLQVPVYKGITFNSRYALEKSFQNAPYVYDEKTYRARDMVNNYTSIAANNSLVYGVPKGGILNQNTFNQDNYTFRNQIDYNSNFNPDHLISAIAGVEIRQTTQSAGSNTYYGYNDQAQRSIPLQRLNGITQAITGNQVSISNPQTVSTGISRRFLSYYSNASYTYKNRYTLSGSARLDDYNNFGLDKKYRRTPLWSGGLSWKATEEEFLKNVSWLDNLNMRLTYGINGNISLLSLPFTNFSTVSNDGLTQLPYVDILSLSNPSFSWERTKVLNAGLNFSLFKSRVNGSVDVYSKKGTNLLYQYVIDPTYGTSSVFRNGAALNGNGIEVNLNMIAVQSEDWSYTPGINLAYNTNEVISVPIAAQSLNSGYVGYLPGYSNDYLFVYRWAGLDKTGQPTIYDQNGKILDNKTAITSRDALKYAGRTNAPYNGAINQTLRYKNFNLFVQVIGRFDYVFLRRSLNRYQTNSFYSFLDLSKDIASRWKKSGDEANTNVPGLTGINFNSLDRYSNSDMMVEPGDHIRIRQVSLTYGLAENIAKKLRMSNLSLTAGMRDLGIIWKKNKAGIDPNYQPSLASITNLPPAVSFNFSLNANF